jgi:hypothetical protein
LTKPRFGPSSFARLSRLHIASGPRPRWAQIDRKINNFKMLYD